jgi:hypothetical protein
MGLNPKLVLEAMGRELFPAIQKIGTIYQNPYLEEYVEMPGGRVEVEESVRLAQIGEVGVWARGKLVLQIWSFYPSFLDLEIVLQPEEKRPRIEAEIQWDLDRGLKDVRGSKLSDPRVLAAFRRIGLELVRKLLAQLQERREKVEASPEFQEALRELEALVALWGEDKR